MTVLCPCCSTPVEEIDVEMLMTQLSPVAARAVDFLEKHPDQYVSSFRLADWVFRNDREGGPAFASDVVKRALHRDRPVMQSLGWDVVSKMGKTGGFRLKRID